jgi:gamma-glutamyltranspeptidase/glutathione hydrolase
MKANDGLLRADDLALIPWPMERKTVGRRYRSVLIETMPPPGAGRVLLLVMMLLNRLPSRFLRAGSEEMHHYLAETLRKAFLYRKDRPFDANTYPQLEDRIMLSHRFVDALAATVRAEIDPELPHFDPEGEDIEETTHFSVMDADGNAVTVTQSVELVYGSKAAAEGLGFLYNNYLMALETRDPSHPYYLRPNAIPWSTAAPTLVYTRGRPWLALGSPGSERIFSTLAQVLTNLVDGSRSLDDAINQPRLHCSIGGRLQLEAARFRPEVMSYLKDEGYKIIERDAFAFELGCAQAVMRCQTQPGFQGVADPRRDGTAAGPES